MQLVTGMLDKYTRLWPQFPADVSMHTVSILRRKRYSVLYLRMYTYSWPADL